MGDGIRAGRRRRCGSGVSRGSCTGGVTNQALADTVYEFGEMIESPTEEDESVWKWIEWRHNIAFAVLTLFLLIWILWSCFKPEERTWFGSKPRGICESLGFSPPRETSCCRFVKYALLPGTVLGSLGALALNREPKVETFANTPIPKTLAYGIGGYVIWETVVNSLAKFTGSKLFEDLSPIRWLLKLKSKLLGSKPANSNNLPGPTASGKGLGFQEMHEEAGKPGTKKKQMSTQSTSETDGDAGKDQLARQSNHPPAEGDGQVGDVDPKNDVDKKPTGFHSNYHFGAKLITWLYTSCCSTCKKVAATCCNRQTTPPESQGGEDDKKSESSQQGDLSYACSGGSITKAVLIFIILFSANVCCMCSPCCVLTIGQSVLTLTPLGVLCLFYLCC